MRLGRSIRWAVLVGSVALLGGCGGTEEAAPAPVEEPRVEAQDCGGSFNINLSLCRSEDYLKARANMFCEERRARIGSYTLGSSCGGGLYKSITFACCN